MFNELAHDGTDSEKKLTKLDNDDIEVTKDGTFRRGGSIYMAIYNDAGVMVGSQIIGEAGLQSVNAEFEILTIGTNGIIRKVVNVVNVISNLGKQTRTSNFAHPQKKQSSGKSRRGIHDKQYIHGGKNRPENPNKRKGADDRRENGKKL